MASRKFEILLAETAGFCMGVHRAVRMVLDAAQDPTTSLPIWTPGPLIHNRQVLQVLRRRGILAMDKNETDGTGTAVVRAHGLPREKQQDLRDRFSALLDATCPHVRKVQRIVEEHASRGDLCVVVGDRGHAEVEAVLSFADGAGHVVAGPEEVDQLPPAEQVIVVAQTTQDEEVFRRTVAAIRKRYGECRAFETICRSTARRQAEVRKMADQVDAMVVVGGHNSANTRRLADISSAAGVPTYQVETEDELAIDEILRHRRVGLTAGASTPNWMIRKVVLRLLEEHRRRSRPVRHFARKVVGALIYSNFYTAGAVAALCFAAAHLLRAPAPRLWMCVIVSFLFVLGQQILNQYSRRESLYLSEPARSDFFMANEKPLVILGVGAAIAAPVAAFLLGLGAFALVVVGSMAGLMYRIRLPRPFAERLRLRSLEQIPASKEIFVGLAWGTLAALIPALVSGAGWPGGVTVFAVCFLAAFERTLALDLRDVEADQLVGRETLVRFLGPGRASGLFFVLVALSAALLTGGAMGGYTSAMGFALLPGLLWALAYFVVLRSRRVEEDTAGLLVDGQFYLMGLLGLLWVLGSGAGRG